MFKIRGIFKLKKIIAIVIITIIMCNVNIEGDIEFVYASESASLDIIFIVDHSNSMNGRDPGHMALEMIEAFVDTTYSQDVRVGFIAYNDAILASTEGAAPIQTKEQRDALKEMINSTAYVGNTDIGLAFTHAMAMIDSDRKTIFVLLSDGETDLTQSTTGRTNEDSDRDVEETIQFCVERDIPIYTIAFGEENTSNRQYLIDLSGQANAESFHATGSYDLIDIFYKILDKHMNFQLTPVSESSYSEGKQHIYYSLSDSKLAEINCVMISNKILSDALIYSNGEQIEVSKLNYYISGKVPADESGNREIEIVTDTVQDQELKVILLGYEDVYEENVSDAVETETEEITTVEETEEETVIQTAVMDETDSKKQTFIENYLGILLGIIAVAIIFLLYISHYKNKKSYDFTGKLNVYFTRLPEGLEIEPLTFALYQMADKKINLGYLLEECGDVVRIMGLRHIEITAGENRSILITNRSNNLLMVRNTVACKNVRYRMKYGDVAYITYEKDVFEMEIHYVSVM